MGIKTYNPYTPSRRQMTGSDFSEITKTAPEKSLVVSLSKNSGRNNQGKITVRHRGGGVKRKYRVIDFKRKKDGIPATVIGIEYDPNRTANIALISYADGEKAYILAPEGLTDGMTVMSGATAEVRVGNCLPLELIPVGTMAHEWIMCSGQGNHKHNPSYSNWYALDAWVKEYGVLNGIALTDTITTDCFLKDFQLTYATLFSGVRHDSGDPIAWGEKMIKHYESLGIDPKTKTLLFSDSLDFDKADQLFHHFHNRVNVAFGIGTYISNDTDVPALNIVMKTTKCNGMDVAKLSDVEGKGMCKNPEYVDYLRRCIDWRMNYE